MTTLKKAAEMCGDKCDVCLICCRTDLCCDHLYQHHGCVRDKRTQQNLYEFRSSGNEKHVMEKGISLTYEDGIQEHQALLAVAREALERIEHGGPYLRIEVNPYEIAREALRKMGE